MDEVDSYSPSEPACPGLGDEVVLHRVARAVVVVRGGGGWLVALDPVAEAVEISCGDVGTLALRVAITVAEICCSSS